MTTTNRLTQAEVRALADLSWELDHEARKRKQVADYLAVNGTPAEARTANAEADARWVAAELIDNYIEERNT